MPRTWVVVTFKIDKELLGKLDYYATTHGTTRSDIIRQVIKEFLEKQS